MLLIALRASDLDPELEAVVRLQDAEEAFPREQTVAGAGIGPMDTVEVFFEPVVAEAG